MVDVSRDPRWGRVAEGSGEDPFLGAAMAAARVRGFQGDDYSAPDRSRRREALVGYGAAEGGRDYNTVDLSEQRLRNLYLPPFQAAVQAGVATVMSAFNDAERRPGAPATTTLISEILKGEWQFDGLVVSD